MKELSIEQKAKAYDEAIERANDILKGYNPKEGSKATVNYIFPELHESEDEKIKKRIIQAIKIREKEMNEEWSDEIAWLENQGEQKSADTCDSLIIKSKEFPASEKRDFGYFNESVDKVEPKFKVGDWVACKGLNTILIVNIDDDKYEVKFINGNKGFPHIEYVDKNFHLWTVQDAKDGDVLAYETDEEDLWIMIYWSLYEPYEGHVHYHALLVNDNFSDKGTCCICINDLKPATKEQRDLLFQKMHEAGYEWDAKNKELNKIYIIDEGKAEMDYCFTKMMNGEKVSSTWSEEDEAKLKSACTLIRNTRLNGNEGVVDSTIDWLKFLKQRIRG